MIKLRTIIIIDSEHDLHGMSPEDFVKDTQDSLKNGTLYVDEFMETSEDVTILVFNHG